MKHIRYKSAFIIAATLALSAPLPALSQEQDNQVSSEAKTVIENWKEKPQKVAHKMIEKYGAPDEVTQQRLVWHDNGPWKRTELVNEEIEHNFPMPHKDMLLQTVSYNIPADKFDELAEYDGSIIAERTRGELSARCDKEAANFLAVNLAHDIITGKRSVEEAREEYGKQIIAFAEGESAPLTEKLNFEPQQDAGDPGETTLDESTIERVKKLMKEKDEQ